MSNRYPTSAPLPIMSFTARRVRVLTHSQKSTHADIESVVLNDPGATLAIYRALERRRPGASDEASGPAHAISMVGMDAFRSIFRNVPVIDGRKVMEHILSPGFAYGQAAHAGWYARRIAETLGFGQAIEMQVAALLQHPSVLTLWHQDFESAARASNATRDGVTFETAFRAELGLPVDAADQVYIEAWKLPQLAREAAGEDPEMSRQARCVAVATRMARVAYAGWPDEAVAATIAELAELLPERVRDPGNWWKCETVAAAHNLQFWDYPLPARELALESDVVVELRPASPQAHAESGHGLQQLLGGALKRLAHSAGTRRVIFAKLSRDRSRLRTRLALGGTPDDALRQLDLSMSEKHLFSLLLTRAQAVHVAPDNHQRYAPYLESVPLDKQALAGFYATSLFVDGRPVGILYADGGHPDDQGYSAFRQAAAGVTQLLESHCQKAA